MDRHRALDRALALAYNSLPRGATTEEVNHLYHYGIKLIDELRANEFEPYPESKTKAAKLQRWLSDQKYGEQPLLHPIVVVDFVSSHRFIESLAKFLEDLN